MSDWIEVGRLEDIPQLGARVVRHGDEEIAVFRNSEDEVFALLNRCPHKGGPLAEGIVHGKRVTCPLHNWNIELDCGAVVAPDEGCVPSYPVKLEDGKVLLSLNPSERGECTDAA